MKDMPKEKHKDMDFIVEQLDWEANVDPHFKHNHYLEPIPTAARARTATWTSGSSTARSTASSSSPPRNSPSTPAKRPRSRTTAPTASSASRAAARSTAALNSPKMIRFYELTEDEYFFTEAAAKSGVTFENTSNTEPLVILRYFGPEANPDAPALKYTGNVKL